MISAGATTTYRVDLQDGYGGAQFPGVTGYLNNDISSFSSGGFEQSGRTVDVVAPGELNWSLCSTDTAKYFDCVSYGGNPTPVIPFGGTSESAPLTAGVAALVIQAYEKTHGGAAPSPQVVKQIIVSTTDDIGSPADQQGAGLIDAYKAVQAAESYKAPASVPAPAGDTLLDSATQLNAIGAPGTPETLTDTITNNGASRQTISVSARALGAYRTIKTAKVTLSDTASPQTTDWTGTAANYEPITFTVPPDQNRLSASIAFQNASPTDLHARVRLTLVDPAGRLAAYSVPQGDGNYGNVQVTNPDPGTWTAYVWSRVSSQGGTTGPVVFGASVANYVRFGRVSPATLTLDPGQSSPVTLHVATPSQPGDASGAIVLSSDSGPAFGRQSTIPVTLRSLIPNGPTSFTGTLTGGNGRSFITGQTFYYQFDLAAARPELNVAVKLANNPDNPFSAFLISPTGEALAFASNDLFNGTTETPEIGAQLHVLAPAQGAWTLIVAFIPAVSGTALSEPFTVSANENAISASSSGLPDSPSVQLAAGQPVTYDVTITNHGPAPEAFFTDARLPDDEDAPAGPRDQRDHDGAAELQRAHSLVPGAESHDRVRRDGEHDGRDADPVRLSIARGRPGHRLDGRQLGQRHVRRRSDRVRPVGHRPHGGGRVWGHRRPAGERHDIDDDHVECLRPDDQGADRRPLADQHAPQGSLRPDSHQPGPDRHHPGDDHPEGNPGDTRQRNAVRR